MKERIKERNEKLLKESLKRPPIEELKKSVSLSIDEIKKKLKNFSNEEVFIRLNGLHNAANVALNNRFNQDYVVSFRKQKDEDLSKIYEQLDKLKDLESPLFDIEILNKKGDWDKLYEGMSDVNKAYLKKSGWNLRSYKNNDELLDERLKEDSIEQESKETVEEMKQIFNEKITSKNKIKLDKLFEEMNSTDTEIRSNAMRQILIFSDNVNTKQKIAINKELINRGLKPIVDGLTCNVYEDKEYYYETNQTKIRKKYAEDTKNIDNSVGEDALGSYVQNIYYEQLRLSNYIGGSLKDEVLNNQIEAYIDNNTLKEDMLLTRYVRFDDKDNVLSQPWLFAKEGDIIEDKSFTSFTSFTSVPGTNITGDFKITLLAQKGQKIANVKNLQELEYVAQRNSKYKILKRGFSSIVVQIIN